MEVVSTAVVSCVVGALFGGLFQIILGRLRVVARTSFFVPDVAPGSRHGLHGRAVPETTPFTRRPNAEGVLWATVYLLPYAVATPGLLIFWRLQHRQPFLTTVTHHRASFLLCLQFAHTNSNIELFWEYCCILFQALLLRIGAVLLSICLSL